MTRKIKMQRWIPSLIAAVALAGFAGLCQAQPLISYTFNSDVQGWYNAGPTNATYSWDANNGLTGAGDGCLAVTFNTVSATEMDPQVDVSVDTMKYYSVEVDISVAPGSGTDGNGSYGNLQCVLRDSSWSWDSIWHGQVWSSGYQHYTFVIAKTKTEARLVFQLQSSSGTYSGPVTVYIDNVKINPIPNPNVLTAFTAGYDASLDAPFYNPVNQAGPTYITPAGSWYIQIVNPGGYSGWNQVSPATFDTRKYEWIGFDVYLDGTSGTKYGGTQLLITKNVWTSWQWLGSVTFDASMVGKWTHFNFPCAASGVTNCMAMVFQGTPGSDGGTDTTTFHIDNIVLWNPVTIPKIVDLTPGTPGGLKISVDDYGTGNLNDQEGITSPRIDTTSTNFFWINQTPAIYSFSLTNFPSPNSAPGFDAHVYLCNGDSLEPLWSGAFVYNQTYSGVNYNAPDYLGLHVQNGTNGGVVAIVDWKTNAPNFNATNTIVFTFPTMASANGTWSLHFTDNTHGSVVAADDSVNNFTLPDFFNDPGYTANFTPVTSMVQFGVFKNGNATNNNQSATFTHVLVTNAVHGVMYNDTFSGPGLTANYAWQVAEYYLNPANRAIWQPYGTAWWLRWNVTQIGWDVQSTGDLLGSWGSAGVTYTYPDGTGTNTLGAVPAASLPAGNAAFFRLQK
jgi:hypothetical protein